MRCAGGTQRSSYATRDASACAASVPAASSAARPRSAPHAISGDGYAAATRYAGDFPAEDGRPLPAVRYWTAWNEPNDPIWLAPQWKKVAGKWTIESARNYVKICNAVYAGVHQTALANEKVRRTELALAAFQHTTSLMEKEATRSRITATP